jgi:tRNA (mo5U34)-methyltransferase
MPTPDELQAQADAHIWFHTIDLGDGVVTKGIGVQSHGTEILPDVRGRSVLDIGAWDGNYSFLAEKAGAGSVVALDHYAWGVNFGARDAYWRECKEKGIFPDHSRDLTDFWAPELPGQRGFHFAANVLHSQVQPAIADFATTDLDALGQFDVTLYLGVLYHMKEPLTCLERVRAVTKEVAVIETEAMHIHNHDRSSLLQFYAGNSLRVDFGNWFVPTIECLHELCRVAGFTSVRTLKGPPGPSEPNPEGRRARLGRRLGRIPRTEHLSAPTQNYRAVVHAYV